MGVIRLLQGKHKEAIKCLNKAIELNPEDAGSYFFRGIAYVLQNRKDRPFVSNPKDFTKAIIDFEKTMQFKKDPALMEQADKWKKNVISQSSHSLI